MPSINDALSSAHHSVRVPVDTANDVSLDVQVFNPHIDVWNKKTVLLLHGFPEAWFFWRPQVDALVGAGFQVVIPDQRGYNKSSKPPTTANGRNYTLTRLSNDVVALIDYLKLGKVMLVGHDFGGAVSWFTAMAHPELVERMVIMSLPHPKIFFPAWANIPAQKMDSIYIENFLTKQISPSIIQATRGGVLALTMTQSSNHGTFDTDTLDAFRNAWLRTATGELLENLGDLASAIGSISLKRATGTFASLADGAQNTGDVSNTPWAGAAMLNWYSALLANWEIWKGSPAGFPWPSTNGVVEVPTLVLEGDNDAFFINSLLAPSVALCKAAGSGGKVVLGTTHWMAWDAPNRVNKILVAYFRDSHILDDAVCNTKDVSKY